MSDRSFHRNFQSYALFHRPPLILFPRLSYPFLFLWPSRIFWFTIYSPQTFWSILVFPSIPAAEEPPASLVNQPVNMIVNIRPVMYTCPPVEPFDAVVQGYLTTEPFPALLSSYGSIDSCFPCVLFYILLAV